MGRSRRDRSGEFRLIDMLVLIFVLAVLFVLLFPRPDHRERAPWIVCTNNLRQLCTVLLNYENSHGQYPGYANVLMTSDDKPFVDPDTGKVSPVSFVVPILPLLDRQDIYGAWTTPLKVRDKNNAAPPLRLNVRLQILRCPSDRPPDRLTPVNSYVVNCGMKDFPGSATMPRDWNENGVFFDQFTGDPRVTGGKRTIERVTMSSAHIARGDGLQNTLLVSENVDAGLWTDTDEAKVGMLWNAEGLIDRTKNSLHLVPPHDSMQINHGIRASETEAGRKLDPAIFARPSSYHPGGANVAFCDGRVQFLSDQIDYYVYCLLMSSNGQCVREPGSNQVIPGFDVKIKDEWINP